MVVQQGNKCCLAQVKMTYGQAWSLGNSSKEKHMKQEIKPGFSKASLLPNYYIRLFYLPMLGWLNMVRQLFQFENDPLR